MNPIIIDPIMTLEEVAAYLKISEKTALRMVRAHKLPGVKVSNQWRFVRAVIDDWLCEGMAATDVATEPAAVAAPLNIPMTRLVSPERIVMDIKPGDKNSVLLHLAGALQAEGRVPDSRQYAQLLAEREQLVSTAVASGLALPHLRHPEDAPVRPPCVVLGVCPHGTDFSSLDGEKTYVLALPCSPDEATHVHLLARVSMLLRHPGVMKSLVSARTPGDVMAIVASAEYDLNSSQKDNG